MKPPPLRSLYAAKLINRKQSSVLSYSSFMTLLCTYPERVISKTNNANYRANCLKVEKNARLVYSLCSFNFFLPQIFRVKID